MKFIRSKLVIGLFCIVLGLGLAFAGIPRMYGESVQTTPVFIAQQDILPGTVITVENIEQIHVPVELAVENAVTGNVAIGQHALVPIYKGDVVTYQKLTAEYFPDDTYSLGTEKGKQVVSISIRNLAASAAARIKPGDVVSVYALPRSQRSGSDDMAIDPDSDSDENQMSQPYEPPRTIVYPELQYLEVAAIISSSGTYAEVKNELGEGEENRLPVTVSFYATKEQAMRLTEIEMSGSAQISFVARGEAAYAFIPEEEKILHLGAQVLAETGGDEQ